MKTTLAKILFWMGDKVSVIMIRYDWGLLYPIYNKLMVWSDKLSPWPPYIDDEEE